MNAAEIVVREMQSNGGLEVRQLFAEGICEPRKSPHRHSHGQVLPFYKRRTHVVRVGIALSDLGYNPRDAWWGVPRIGSVKLSVITKQFRELREVYIQTKAHGHSALIVIQAVSSDLRPAFDSVITSPKEIWWCRREDAAQCETRE